MQTRECYRATGGTTCGCAKSEIKACAVVGKSIEVGRFQGRIAVGSKVRTLIVGHEEHDVSLGGMSMAAAEHSESQEMS
jgi:hypothetical protein